jgi:CheY-like chemotaxis protein
MTHRILIIDDEDDIRQVAAMSLETVAGWDVVLASSGKQGIERASSEQPDAILLDVMMPELLLTAKVQGPDQRKFAEMGVAATLFKPFDPLTLARQISAALGWKEG